MKTLLVTLILCFGMILIGHAQQQEREIYTVLAYDVFEPELWYASATEEEDRTKGTWRSTELDSVAYLEYLHFDDGIEPDELDAYFGEEWFSVTLSTFQDWKERVTCASDDILLFEFDLTFEDDPYKMRYWFESITQDRVTARYLVFPAENPQAMEDYSALWYPDFVSCEDAA